MFGYININRPELKVRELDEYQGFYCGLCRSLKESSGIRGQMTLTYDMTFLGILLTALYEEPVIRSHRRCPTHPWKKVLKLTNRYTRYAADMNVLLAAYNIQDNWLDDRSLKSLFLYLLLKAPCRRIHRRYPRQGEALLHYLEELHRCESERIADMDLAAGLTGKMLGEIFVCEEDVWSPELRRMGFYLGKFIYLMDAWDDYEEDQRTCSYNPWCLNYPVKPPQEHALQILTLMMAEVTRAFEQLPILEEADLLRNILYSGVWRRYNEILQRSSPQNSETNTGGTRS